MKKYKKISIYLSEDYLKILDKKIDNYFKLKKEPRTKKYYSKFIQHLILKSHVIILNIDLETINNMSLLSSNLSYLNRLIKETNKRNLDKEKILKLQENILNLQNFLNKYGNMNISVIVLSWLVQNINNFHKKY